MRSCSRLSRAGGGCLAGWPPPWTARPGHPAAGPRPARRAAARPAGGVPARRRRDRRRHCPGRGCPGRRAWRPVPRWSSPPPGRPGGPRASQLSAAALRASAAASLDRIGAVPGGPLAVLPARLPRGRAAGAGPVAAGRDQPGGHHPGRPGGRGGLRLRLRLPGPTQLRRLLDAGRPGGRVRRDPARRGRATARPAGRGPRGRRPGDHHLRHVGDLRRLRVRRAAAGRGPGAHRAGRA